MLTRAAQTILAELGLPAGASAFVFACAEKSALAQAVCQVLAAQGIEQHLLLLGPRIEGAGEPLRALVEQASADGAGLVFLLQPAQAPFLFDVVGRPDRGLRIAEQRLFCDWLMRPESALRTLAVDRAEVVRYREDLLSRLAGAKRLRITTPAGTDLVLCPRSWHATLGEVYTAPVEDQTHGRVVVDGCAYSGPPASPFALTIAAGRVTNLEDLHRADPQQAWLYRDLTSDASAGILAELGIGINPGALCDQDLMEAEQARGTCHLGFGHNLPYGGENASSVHVDLVMRSPHIEEEKD